MLEIFCDKIIDGTGASPFSGLIAINGNRIAEVQRLIQPSLQKDQNSYLDLTGYTLMPGLIDAHSHIGSVVQPHGSRPAPLAVIAAQIFGNLRRALHEGFTCVRELSGLDGGIASAASLGLIEGPRVLPSGPMISQSSGHGDWRPEFAHDEWTERWPGLLQASILVDGVDDARKVARLAIKDGATQLKVALSGGFSSTFDTPDDVQFSEQELRAIVEVAAAHHKYVAGHAHNSHAIRHGLKAGVRCFEHATFAGRDVLSDVKRDDASIVATLSILDAVRSPEWLNRMAPNFQDFALRAFDAAAEMVRSALDCGLSVGLGSDLTGPSQRDRARELVARATVTDATEAIAAATGNNAKILGIADDCGTIAAGMRADLVAADGDLLSNFALLSQPAGVKFVVQNGEVKHSDLPSSLGTAGALQTRRTSDTYGHLD